MTVHYEELTKLWQAGNFSDAITYFSQSMAKGLLAQEEIEEFNRNLAKFWELIEIESEENPEVMFSLYEMLKKARNWDDQALCRKLEIAEKAIQDIKNRHRTRSEGVGLKMPYELFPQMAV